MRLYDKLNFYCTDHCKCHEEILESEFHIRSKAETHTVEGYNNRGRGYLARFKRKGKRYSKVEYMIQKSLKILFLKLNNEDYTYPVYKNYHLKMISNQKKAHMKTNFLQFVLIFIFTLSACKKDPHGGQKQTVNFSKTENPSGRIKFTTSAEFGDFMERLKKVGGDNVSRINVKELLIQNNIRVDDFVSLKESLNKDEFIKYQASLVRINIKNATLARSVTNTSPVASDQISRMGEDLDEDDYLVPDPYLASVLNEDREIEIGNTVYKITEFGTYVYEPSQEAIVDALVESLRSANYVLKGDLLPGEIPNGDGINICKNWYSTLSIENRCKRKYC